MKKRQADQTEKSPENPLFPAGELMDEEAPVPPFSAFTLQDHDPLTVPYPDEPPDGLETVPEPPKRKLKDEPIVPARPPKGRRIPASAWRYLFPAAILFLLIPAALILGYRASYHSFKVSAQSLSSGLIFPHVFADGTELSGMTPSEAEAVLSSRGQTGGNSPTITIHVGSDTVVLTASDLSDASRFRDTADRAFAVGRGVTDPSGSLASSPFESRLQSVKDAQKNPVVLSSAVSYDPEGVRAWVSSLAAVYDVPAVNAGIVNMDYVSRSFSFSDEQNGRTLDQALLTAEICAALDKGDMQADLTARFRAELPTVRKTDLLNTFGLLNIRSVQLSLPNGDSAVRKLAAQLNGALVQAYAKLSFRAVLESAGYPPAAFDEDPIPTQVASALMEGALCAGLTIEKRFPLSQKTGLIPPGTEAAISPEEDLVLSNPTGQPYCVLCYFTPKGSAAAQGSITLEWYGILGTPGEEVKLSSEKTAETQPPEPIRRRNSALPAGRQILAQIPQKGETWVCSLVRSASGKELRRETLFTTTYAPVRQIIEYNDQTETEGEPAS